MGAAVCRPNGHDRSKQELQEPALPTTYDKVAYPSVLFKRTHPERLAAVATLHGLTPPPLETARVLEIGCGEGLSPSRLLAAS
jgi:hypothetical protein